VIKVKKSTVEIDSFVKHDELLTVPVCSVKNVLDRVNRLDAYSSFSYPYPTKSGTSCYA
jgi:hypothetical protein